MTALKDKIRALVTRHGPISVSDYFALCLADPEHGYYKTRDPFGRGGDFVTAPEISQLFGEMTGLFLIAAWLAADRPLPVRLAEIGPGRGTMMADQLRVISRLAPALFDVLTVHMIETSPTLRLVQRHTLGDHLEKIEWHDDFDALPEGHLLMVGNEFFDAVPFRQFIKHKGVFRERLVGLAEDGELTFAAGQTSIDPAALPDDHDQVEDGTIFEFAPAREAVMARIAGRIAEQGGTALFIDYGHALPGFGDTLQAIRGHRFDPPLAHPGEADLTSHVDFHALAMAAFNAGAFVHGIASQGVFLTSLGLIERAGALGSGKSRQEQDAIRIAVERLAGDGPNSMGELFKVLAISGRELPLPPFATA